MAGAGEDPAGPARVDRVVLVTGARTGIGRATARAFAEAGWTVYAGLRADTAAAPWISPRVQWVQLDVTQAAQRRECIDRIAQREQRLDALINNAGVHSDGPVEEFPEPLLREVMEVNFFAPLLLTAAALPLMRSTPGSVVVMVSSLSGLVGLPLDTAYTASKFALEGATESLRAELAPFSIGVAAIEPGAIATELLRDKVPAARADSPYRAALERLRKNRVPHGDDPGVVADVIFRTVLAGAPALRVPAGPQAEAICARLALLDADARERFIREVSAYE